MPTHSSEIWKPHVVAATVVERDGKFLLVEEEIDGKRVFNQPAGHLDPGESIIDCAVRETIEETAWSVRVEDLLGIYLIETAVPGKSFMRFCFTATALEHHRERALDDEIVRTHWLSESEIIERRERLRSPLVLTAIEAYNSGVRYPLSLLHADLNDS